MKGINEVTLIGVVTSIIAMEDGSAILKLSTRETRSLMDGNRHTVNCTHIVNCYGSVAKSVLSFLEVKSVVFVRGRLDYDINNNIFIVGYSVYGLTKPSTA